MRGSDILFSQYWAVHTSGTWVTKGKKSTEAPLYTPHVLVFQVTHNFICHWQQLTITAVLTTETVSFGVIHHVGLVDLRHLSKMKQLSFHSSEHDLHSFSPKLLSTKSIHWIHLSKILLHRNPTLDWASILLLIHVWFLLDYITRVNI